MGWGEPQGPRTEPHQLALSVDDLDRVMGWGQIAALRDCGDTADDELFARIERARDRWTEITRDE